MPKISARQELLRSIGGLIRLAAIYDDEEEIDDLLELNFAVSSSRFLTSRSQIPKTIEFRNLLWQLPDREFKQVI